MATEVEVLEKVGTYCTEKQYTLDDNFRSQFSSKFAAANAEADINDENISKSIKFALDSAFSAASKGIEAQKKVWDEEKIKLNFPMTLKKNLTNLTQLRKRDLGRRNVQRFLNWLKRE